MDYYDQIANPSVIHISTLLGVLFLIFGLGYAGYSWLRSTLTPPQSLEIEWSQYNSSDGWAIGLPAGWEVDRYEVGFVRAVAATRLHWDISRLGELGEQALVDYYVGVYRVDGTDTALARDTARLAGDTAFAVRLRSTRTEADFLGRRAVFYSESSFQSSDQILMVGEYVVVGHASGGINGVVKDLRPHASLIRQVVMTFTIPSLH